MTSQIISDHPAFQADLGVKIEQYITFFSHLVKNSLKMFVFCDCTIFVKTFHLEIKRLIQQRSSQRCSGRYITNLHKYGRGHTAQRFDTYNFKNFFFKQYMTSAHLIGIQRVNQSRFSEECKEFLLYISEQTHNNSIRSPHPKKVYLARK